MLKLLSVLLVSYTIAIPLNELLENYNANFEENPGLFEGDIELLPGEDPRDRVAMRNRNHRWPNGVVPYVIDTHHFAPSQQRAIHDALKVMSEKTKVNNKPCLTFIPRTNETAYIRYQGGTGCHTPVGYHNRLSAVTLGDLECLRPGSIMHETMHALGFYHEQSRPDRDDYVTIDWSNVIKGSEKDFDKLSSTEGDTLNIQYDYDSVMHYPAYAFAINHRKPTILVKQKGAVIGQRTHLSSLDIRELQVYYDCVAESQTLFTTPAPTVATTPPPVAGNLCTFEAGFCSWKNVGEINWVIKSGATASVGTGPSRDHTGSSTGKYAYLEAAGHLNQKAALLSPTFHPGEYCISLYYHMFGHDEGKLIIDFLGKFHTDINTFVGNQGNGWHRFIAGLRVSSGDFQIKLEGDVSSANQSDIAIDDVTLHKGRCIGRVTTSFNV